MQKKLNFCWKILVLKFKNYIKTDLFLKKKANFKEFSCWQLRVFKKTSKGCASCLTLVSKLRFKSVSKRLQTLLLL